MWVGVVSDRESVEQEIEKIAGGLCCGHDFMYEPILAALLAQRQAGRVEERQFNISAICEYYSDGAQAIVEVIRNCADELAKGE